MGRESGEARACSLLQNWDETGEVDLKERRENEDQNLACMPTSLAYLLLWQAWLVKSQAMSAVARGWDNEISGEEGLKRRSVWSSGGKCVCVCVWWGA